MNDSTRWTDRIVSSSGDWSGNIYDFCFRVYNKLTQDIKVPFKLEGGDRIDDTPVHKALCVFNLIDIGERAGSGIPSILSFWQKEGWGTPLTEESFDPDRIKVTLNFEKSSDKK